MDEVGDLKETSNICSSALKYEADLVTDSFSFRQEQQSVTTTTTTTTMLLLLLLPTAKKAKRNAVALQP